MSEFFDKFSVEDDGTVSAKTDQLTNADWSIIYRAVRKLGYDIRSAADAKTVYGERARNGEYTFNEDQSLALLDAYGIVKIKRTAENPNREKKAALYFGLTVDPREAGYMLRNGSLLDFSGKKDGGSGGVRQMDHRDINAIFDERSPDSESGSNSWYMYRFIAEGNIRLLATQGVTIGQMEPSETQYVRLGHFIRYVIEHQGVFYLDICNDKGYNVCSREYEAKDSPETIIRDIRAYFKNEELPYRSDLAEFIK